MRDHLKFNLWLSLLFFLIAIPADAQEIIIDRPDIQAGAAPATTTSKLITLRVNEILRVKIPQLSSNPTDKIAVILGGVDITSQVDFDGKELIYKSSLVPLPIGEQILTVYTIKSTDAWDQLASFRIRVEPNLAEVVPKSPSIIIPGSTQAASPVIPSESTPPAPEIVQPSTPPPISSEVTLANSAPNSTFTPKFNGNIKSQVLDIRNPSVATAQRPTFINLDFIGGLSTENQISKTRIRSKFTVVGTNFQPESLRFSELREGASQIDLSEYAIEANDDKNQFTIGHLCFGNHPFLLSNLCTRGRKC